MSTFFGVMLLLASWLTGPTQPHTTTAPHAVTHVASSATIAQQSARTPQMPACMSVTVQPGNTLAALFPYDWRTVAIVDRIADSGNLIFPGQVVSDCGGSPAYTAPAAPQSVQNTVMQPTAPNVLAGQPCQSYAYWPSNNIYEWEIPNSCFAGVYYAGYGDCFGWVHHLVPHVASLPAHSTPIIGAVAHFAGGVQGASWQGHWAYVLALSGPWMLISEEANYWRGGYNMVSYRYALQSGGITYYY